MTKLRPTTTSPVGATWRVSGFIVGHRLEASNELKANAFRLSLRNVIVCASLVSCHGRLRGWGVMWGIPSQVAEDEGFSSFLK